MELPATHSNPCFPGAGSFWVSLKSESVREQQRRTYCNRLLFEGIERGGEIREQESVVAWFYRLLRNAAIDHYRREASSGRAMEGFAREGEGAEVPSPDLRNEIWQCVSRVLTELKPEYREALEVVDVGEASLSELGTKTGISANNDAVRVHRARQALQKQVKLTCGACAEHGCIDCRCKSGHSQGQL